MQSQSIHSLQAGGWLLKGLREWWGERMMANANGMAVHSREGGATCRFFLPLPDGWEHVMDGSTPHPFFIDHVHQRTQTLDPRPLPTGWEQMVTQDGWAYFVDHNAKHSYWTHPCSYPLPGPNWQIMYDDDDQLYFIDHDTRKVCL